MRLDSPAVCPLAELQARDEREKMKKTVIAVFSRKQVSVTDREGRTMSDDVFLQLMFPEKEKESPAEPRPAEYIANAPPVRRSVLRRRKR